MKLDGQIEGKEKKGIIESMWQRIKNIYHLGNAFLANLWFGFPSRKLIVIGVTGTDGKTTTVSLIYHILHTAGYNASMISSVGAIIGGKEYDVGFHVTTPSPWALQRFISLCHPELVSGSKSPRAEMPKQVRHDNKDHYLVLEVTSHAIDQNRIWGIPFHIGVLTNVTHEHLDYHKTYENYVKTKAKLLQMARVAVVNRDDNSYELISNLKSQISNLKTQNFITYGMRTNADVNPDTFPFKSNLIGEFNRYNVLAAIAACRSLGIEDETMRKSILTFKPPIGREEIIYKNPFTIMIDFAHTPNAYDAILSSIKPSIKSRLIHVFGSAGERDSSKRPLMGKASAKYSNVIVLTAEDPRSESIEKIMNEIESGITNSKFPAKQDLAPRDKIQIYKIPSRQEAITAAIEMARRGDFVLITGKSHEKSMNYGKGEEPWDEFKAVSQALSVRRDEK